MFIIGTTANPDVLEDMGVVDAFNVHAACAPIRTVEECTHVLQQVLVGLDDKHLCDLARVVQLPVGVKKLLNILETARTFDTLPTVEAFSRACVMFGM